MARKRGNRNYSSAPEDLGDDMYLEEQIMDELKQAQEAEKSMHTAAIMQEPGDDESTIKSKIQSLQEETERRKKKLATAEAAAGNIKEEIDKRRKETFRKWDKIQKEAEEELERLGEI